MVTVTKVNESTFDVTVQAKTTTSHRVTVTDTMYQNLTGGQVGRDELVRQSFLFLLERESNTSILKTFDLSVISRYFPEYESEIKSRLT